MKCKVEKTKNANEVKLEITIEAEKFENAIKKKVPRIRGKNIIQKKVSFSRKSDFNLYLYA